jgi:hypothetical protein
MLNISQRDAPRRDALRRNATLRNATQRYGLPAAAAPELRFVLPPGAA